MNTVPVKISQGLSLDEIDQGLNNVNIRAFLNTIAFGESQNDYLRYAIGTPLTHFTLTDATTKDFPDWSGNGKSHGSGAYQFEPGTWRALRYRSLNDHNLDPKHFISFTDFTQISQDRGAYIYLQFFNAVFDIKNGDITKALNKINPRFWGNPATPADQKTYWTDHGGICGFISKYTSYHGTLSGSTLDNDKERYSICPNTTWAEVNGQTINQKQLNSQLKANIDTIQNNVNVLEVDDTKVNWGSRQGTKEQSDWIGLRQYILYLATTYETESIVPFIELIPKFLLDNPVSNQQILTNNDSVDLTDIDKILSDRFNKSMEKFNSLQRDNGFGDIGIDLMSYDPFQEMINPKKQDTSNNTINNPITRNFGYKLYGNVVLNPGLNGDQISKAGGVGFKSFEMIQGANVMSGMTTINIKLLDVLGNKFFDSSSPWSFILNASQVQGDFYFRYGWQIRIPKFPADLDKSSTSYKFWNHPGWNIFGNGNKSTLENNISILKLKSDIYNLAQKSTDNVLTFTQSPNLNSIYYPGYIIDVNNKNEDKSNIFKIDRSKLNLNNYYVISMINPEVNIDSQTGAVTASIQFRMNTALITCLCPLSQAKNTLSMINTYKKYNLYQLMLNLLKDNRVSSNPKDTNLNKVLDDMINSEFEKNNNPNNNSNKNSDLISIQSWLEVKSLDNNNLSGLLDPRTIPIIINYNRIQEITNNKDAKNCNTMLRQWVFDVCSDNNLTMISAGDPGIGSSMLTSKFIFLLDNNSINNTNQSVINQDAFNAASGFAGMSSIERIILQDDVFSFRFRGSLIEDINIETNNNPSDQQTRNILALSGETIEKYNYDMAQNIDANTKEGQKKFYDELVKKTQSEIIKNPNLVSLEDKKRNLLYILTKMSGITIKCIAHPWLKIGSSIYVKGTGYFDGKYIISKLSHNLESDNKFITTINGVKVLNDIDYANLQQNTKNDQFLAQNDPNANYTTVIPGVFSLPNLQSPNLF